MLDQLNYDNLSIIGCGKHAVCLTDGIYAIKIGRIQRGDVAQMQASGKFSVPIYDYQERTELPEKIRSFLENKRFPITGATIKTPAYLKNKYVSILICGLAHPIISHDVDIDDDITPAENQRLYDICERLRKRYSKATGMVWMDFHPFNVGIYNNRYVILDF